MKQHLAKLLITPAVLVCLQFPSLGYLNQALQLPHSGYNPLPLDVKDEQIVSAGDGSFALFFDASAKTSAYVQIFLNSQAPDASFCPQN